MMLLDASALLALLQEEAGADVVKQALANPQGALISSVNHAEVVARLSDWGMPLAAIQEALSTLPLQVVAFDEALSYRSGQLPPCFPPQKLGGTKGGWGIGPVWHWLNATASPP